jgi:tetratricopeptide (TPR) repeat protein
LLAQAQMNIALRRYAPALARANEALAVIDRTSQAHDYHEAQIVAGYSHAFFGRFSEARRLLEEALAFFERADITQWCGVAHSDLGVTCDLMSDDDGARESYLAALRCFQSTRNTRGIRALTINLAELDFRRGDVVRAVASIENAVRTGGGSDGMLLSNYAAYLLFENRFAEALEYARESLIESTASNHELDKFLALQHVAAALALASDHPDRVHRVATAARLIGYVDRYFDAAFGSREYTERQEHERLLDHLGKAIEPAALNALVAEGAALDHQQALETALRA